MSISDSEQRHDTIPQPTSWEVDSEDIVGECDEDDLMTEQLDLAPKPSRAPPSARPLLRYRTSSSILRNVELSTEGSLPAVMAPSMEAMRVFRAHVEHRGLLSPGSVFGNAQFVYSYPLGVRRLSPPRSTEGAFEWRALADLLLVDARARLHLWAVRPVRDPGLESAKLVGVVMLWAHLLESERVEDVNALLVLRGVPRCQLPQGERIQVRSLNIVGVGGRSEAKDRLQDCKEIAASFVRPERNFRVWYLPND